MKRKYLIIYLNTGGGHFSPANAIADYMKNNMRETAEPVLIDGLKKSPRWVRFILEDGYRILQAKAKWFFEFLYGSNKIPAFGKVTSLLVSFFIYPYLKEVMQREQPDMIINLHFFTVTPIINALKKYNPALPFYTLVTDPYSAHPIWFYQENQNYIVFSEELAKQMRKEIHGIKVYTFPFIVNDKFSKRLEPTEIERIKNELELPTDKNIILILGGSDGIPKGEKILKKLLKKKLDASIIIVCGKNKLLLENTNQIKTENPDSLIKVFGFVKNVYELINISDAVITKCGASTIMEILLLGKTPFVNSYIWEQEKGNVEFLKENKIGIYEPKVKKIVRKVQKFLTDDFTRKYYQYNLEKSELKNGLEDVVNFLAQKSPAIESKTELVEEEIVLNNEVLSN